MNNQQNYYGQIAKLTIPIVLQNLLSTAVNSADVVMLNYVGQAHVSAVSLAAQYANILFMILYGLGTHYRTPSPSNSIIVYFLILASTHLRAFTKASNHGEHWSVKRRSSG
mgnify:CR=1 FL=1